MAGQPGFEAAPRLRARSPLVGSVGAGGSEAVGLVVVNVFVVGLDQHNERILKDLPDAEQYRFHPVLSIEELRPVFHGVSGVGADGCL